MEGLSASRLARVVDLSGFLGRAASRLLVAAGADVVKVRLPPAYRPAVEDEPDADPELARLHWGAGARECNVDPSDRAELSRLQSLVRGADILIDSSVRSVGMPADAGKLTEYDHLIMSLVEPNQHLVRVSVTPYGGSGPKHSWQATDLTLAAAGGMMSLSGRPDGPPLAPPRKQAVQQAGADAAIGALAALRVVRHMGYGQQVEVSAQESVAAALEYGALLWIHEQRVHRRNGDRYPHVPHKLFPCRDGWVAGGFGGSPRMWSDLLDWMIVEGAAGELTDPRWDDEAARTTHRETLYAVVESFTRRFGRHEFAAEARRRRLPWAAVDPPGDVVDNPQLRSRAFFATIDRADGAVTDVGASVVPPAERPMNLLIRDAGDLWSDVPSAPTGRAPLSGEGALAGVRVLDLTWVLAGPYATKILADHGADVIKVESRARPDPTRFASSMNLGRHPDPGPDTSGYFNNYNRNKRSITLDLRNPEATAALEVLVSQCDVVVENFSAGTMDRMGFGFDRLTALRPGLILTSMSGMGHTGPWHDSVTYADTLSAASGMTAETAGVDAPPIGLTFGLGDMIAGMHAVIATLAALESRDRTGRGRHIDLSQLEAVVSQLDTAILEVSSGRVIPLERDNRHPAMAPHGAFPCRGVDRWCAIAVTGEPQWSGLVAAMDREDLAEDDRFATLAARKANEDELEFAVSDWTRRHDAHAVESRLQAAGVAAAVVQDGEDLVEHDTHLRERRFYVPHTHPVTGEFLHEGVVAHLSSTPGGIRHPAPMLGQHTMEILRDLAGLDAQAIARLEECGALR